MKEKRNESTYAVEVMSESEMTEVNGGLLLEVISGCAVVFTIGYQMGKDCAEADRRNR